MSLLEYILFIKGLFGGLVVLERPNTINPSLERFLARFVPRLPDMPAIRTLLISIYFKKRSTDL
jgi:hypothetical protein